MLIVHTTPGNYHPAGGECYCIIDPEDGDVYGFYHSKEEANEAYKKAFETDHVKTWKDYDEYIRSTWT